jgi:cysteine-rich repeat protein
MAALWLCGAVWPLSGCSRDSHSVLPEVPDAGATSPARPDAGQREDDSRSNPISPTVAELDAGLAPPSEPAAMDKPDADATGCGDGVVQPGEACDDGNDKPGDGCSADCTQRERDYVCPAPGKACVSTVVCGDKRIDFGEQCEDNDVTPTSGDGCSATCQIEPPP